MNSSDKAELRDIETKLASIISQLQEISDNVRNEFDGIGSEQCANCIDRKINKLKSAQKKLSKVD